MTAEHDQSGSIKVMLRTPVEEDSDEDEDEIDGNTVEPEPRNPNEISNGGQFPVIPSSD